MKGRIRASFITAGNDSLTIAIAHFPSASSAVVAVLRKSWDRRVATQSEKFLRGVINMGLVPYTKLDMGSGWPKEGNPHTKNVQSETERSCCLGDVTAINPWIETVEPIQIRLPRHRKALSRRSWATIWAKAVSVENVKEFERRVAERKMVKEDEVSYEIKESKGVHCARGDRAHDIGFDTVDQFVEVLMKDVASVYRIVPVSEPVVGDRKGGESDGLLDRVVKGQSFLVKGRIGFVFCDIWAFQAERSPFWSSTHSPQSAVVNYEGLVRPLPVAAPAFAAGRDGSEPSEMVFEVLEMSVSGCPDGGCFKATIPEAMRGG
ncbi:hypothetical protein EDD85DRAFT_940446 [Armillaria nabsnona]|nr:hypothetical protein EDD85DRAFT_940446 [Armillaria nabsnona]